jgi:hypothetical protein
MVYKGASFWRQFAVNETAYDKESNPYPAMKTTYHFVGQHAEGGMNYGGHVVLQTFPDHRPWWRRILSEGWVRFLEIIRYE